MELRGKRVLVVGLGRSGVGVARLCAERGARVTVTDRKDASVLAPQLEALAGCASLELGGQKFFDRVTVAMEDIFAESGPVRSLYSTDCSTALNDIDQIAIDDDLPRLPILGICSA